MTTFPGAQRFFNAQNRLSSVKAYLDMIGRPSPRATAAHVGTLYDVKVKAIIHYQPYDGAANYHTNDAFDEALARVVVARFGELAAQAIEILKSDAIAFAAEAKEEIRALDEILREALAAPLEPVAQEPGDAA